MGHLVSSISFGILELQGWAHGMDSDPDRVMSSLLVVCPLYWWHVLNQGFAMSGQISHGISVSECFCKW